jgi:acetyl esterase/lipase
MLHGSAQDATVLIETSVWTRIFIMRNFFAFLLVCAPVIAVGQARTPAAPMPPPLRNQPETQTQVQPQEKAFASVDTELNVVYGTVDGAPLRLDVYHPHGKPARPLAAIILIHGGGWSAFDKSTMGGLGHWLAQNNFVVFSIDYRLFDGTHNLWPAQLEDAQRAVRWVRANAATYNVDPARIGAAGHSAGAQMAALLGEINISGSPSSKVSAVLDISGPADFTSMPADADNFFAQFLGGTEQQQPAAWKSASPALLVTHQTAPFLIVQGTRDEEVPIAQSEEFTAALKKAKVPVTFIQVDDVHTFTTEAAKRRLAIEAVQFFDKYLQQR